MPITSATLDADTLRPQKPGGTALGTTLAVIAHLLLLAALAFGVHWKSSEPESFSAELWSAVPQAAAPRAQETQAAKVEPKVEPKPEPKVEPPPPKVDPTPPRPTPKVAETPPPKPVPDAQIAIEKARAEKVRKQEIEDQRVERELKAAQLKAKAKADQARAAADARKAADKLAEQRQDRLDKEARDKADKAQQAKLADQKKREEQQLAATRDAYLKRMQGQLGATGAQGSPGTAAQSSGPSASYAGRIKARIKPNIVFGDDVAGNPAAEVEVRVAPDGTITGRKLVKASGNKDWDDAVLRAVDRTEVLPRDIDGRVQPVMTIVFKARE